MIDWVNVFFNALWILGAAVILAALSFYSYDARRRGERLRARLAAAGFQAWLSVGLVLISLSLALIGPRWWERVLWGLLCAMSGWQLWVAWHEWQAKRATDPLPEIETIEPTDPQTPVEEETKSKLDAEPSTSPEHEAEPVTWRVIILPLVLFVVVLFFYIVTLAPTVLWGDDAYFQRTAFEGTLRADGGGHWLWFQAARLFLRLPWGDAAYRVNLLSAVAAACTIVLVYVGGRALGLTSTGATIASVSLTVSHTFWSYAVRAEVYAIFLLLVVLQLWLWSSWRSERTWPILAAALLFGVTVLAHQMALLLLPAIGFVLWQRREWLSKRRWLWLLLCCVVGLLPFFAAIKWQMGDRGLFDGLRLYFFHSGDDYSHTMFDFSLSSLPRDAILWGGFLGLQFVGLAGLLGLWGWIDVWRKGQATPWIALAIVYATDVLFAFSYHINEQYAFYLPSYLAFTFFIGRGWQALSTKWPGVNNRRAKLLIIALIALVPILTYDGTVRLLTATDTNPMDIRELPGRDPNRFFLWPAKNGYFGAADYGCSALETLPPDSILLVDYTPMETILYYRSVEGLRPDIRIKYVIPGQDLAPMIAQFPPDSTIYLAGNDPNYYNTSSLPNATLRPDGVVYHLVLENKQDGN
ncbi:MAG: DUF2723 domain-containing protein [Chloroflexi bacterium]|nr:DUF2723 domain-containing protein [Chloroflexota bacterium]